MLRKIPQILVILGPTASGKSNLAIRIAQRLRRRGTHAEVISADSRQVYRGLNIGSGKITKREMQGIPHHLLDIASPRRQFSVARYQKTASRILYTLLASGYTPIVCGGTGHYIDTLLGTQIIPNVLPDPKLRTRLGKLSTPDLFARLKKLDPQRAKTIDRHNPRRLIRALEIVIKTGRPVPNYHSPIRTNGGTGNEKVIRIGLLPPPQKLRQRINARLDSRLCQGLIAEVKKLHAPPVGGGLSWKRLDELGLEYRYISRYLRGAMSKDEMITKLETEIWRYAKRQTTWFKRDKAIHWARNEREAVITVRRLLKSSA